MIHGNRTPLCMRFSQRFLLQWKCKSARGERDSEYDRKLNWDHFSNLAYSQDLCPLDKHRFTRCYARCQFSVSDKFKILKKEPRRINESELTVVYFNVMQNSATRWCIFIEIATSLCRKYLGKYCIDISKPFYLNMQKNEPRTEIFV